MKTLPADCMHKIIEENESSIRREYQVLGDSRKDQEPTETEWQGQYR